MRQREARARETREWMAKAAEDLDSCKALIATGHFSNDEAEKDVFDRW